MNFIYPLLIAFILVFISELGDKTQLLVLSFSTKVKTPIILTGITVGSLLSHGIAILFGSFLGNVGNSSFHNILKIITYSSFILFGILTFFQKEGNKKNRFSIKFSNCKLGQVLLIALSIAIGEIGDKTFLASIGLGIQYFQCKLFLIIGAVLGMVLSDYIAICLGKFLSKKLHENAISIFSSILFFIFGILGFVSM